MEEKTAGLNRFFTACDELITGKFILADTKIGELLRSVATCDELKGLFSAVTDGFDYPAAKSACLILPEGRGLRGQAYLPTERGELLAFVFCLLVEFDSGAMRFNDFLQSYFYVDGSYTASYSLFVDRVIRPFRDIVRECFPAPVEDIPPKEKLREEENKFGVLSEKIASEQKRVAALSLPGEDATAAGMMLAEMLRAAERGDEGEIKALLCGYLYFLQVTDISDETSGELFRLAAAL